MESSKIEIKSAQFHYKSSHKSVGLRRTLCEYLVSVLSVLHRVFVLIFHRINFSSSATTSCHVLIRVKSSRMRVKDLKTVAERKKRSRNFNSAVSFGKPE